MFNLLPFLLSLLFSSRTGLAAFATIFWIWVLVDCLTKEPSEGNDKVAWILFILFVPLVGALIYFFVRRPERVKVVGH
ncbi:MAG: PLDc_N domain-containing protein [Ktedonobacteraceae bacterium]|nr:PLDc_N domain-containing protein [Ktedonobacteraceae bacterium]